MNDSIVKVENLWITFGDHQALEDINLAISENMFVAIVGPNGAGKTTFLKVLLGLIKPNKGSVSLFGADIKLVDPSLIGYVPQVKTMDRGFPALSIELVLTGLNRGWPWHQKKVDHERAYTALEQVRASHLATRSLSRLSGGELQRVCLARSIVHEPQLVILDEPATGIDTIGEADMYNLLEDYQAKSNATVLMITHDWHAATHHADRVLLLNKKQISFGPPKEALKEDNLRRAFGHIGHEHTLKFLMNSDD